MKGYIKIRRIKMSLKVLSSMTKSIPQESMKTKVSLVLTNHVIRPKCITILYHNLPLFIDIFHTMMPLSWCFGLFYPVYKLPVLKQQNQESAGKSAHRIDIFAQLQKT